MIYHFLRISSVKEVRHRASVSAEMRINWERKLLPDPSLMKLQFDWLGGLKSSWNVMFLNKLLEFLRMEWERLQGEWNLEWYTDEHFRVKISNHFESLRREWKQGQPLPGESLEECLRRLRANRDMLEKRARESVRRIHVSFLKFNLYYLIRSNFTIQKYRTRTHITTCGIAMRKRAIQNAQVSIDIESDESRTLQEDLRIWEMAGAIINRLGPEGMSSEDSESEEDGKVVFRVKIVIWRRRMEAILRLIDRQRYFDNTIYTQKGAKPGKRLRIPEGVLEADWQWKSRRVHPDGLPEALYDPSWLQNIQGSHAVLSFQVSHEEFEYFEIEACT